MDGRDLESPRFRRNEAGRGNKPAQLEIFDRIYGLALHGNSCAAVSSQFADLGSAIRKFHVERAAIKGKPRATAFTPDGKYLITAGGRHVQVWETASGPAKPDRCCSHCRITM